MAGEGDKRMEAAVLAAVGSKQVDLLALRETLRAKVPGALSRHEGGLHALLHRLVKSGRLHVVGVSDRGIALYATVAAQAAAVVPASADASRTVRRVARAVRRREDRARVSADVAAHLAALEADGGEAAFGSVRGARHLLHRVDRRRPTVIFALEPADVFRRFCFHDGLWILGVVLAFFLIRGLMLEVFRIPSGSMKDTLLVEDRVAVWKLGGQPERFSIVTYERPNERGQKITYVKRMIGLGGEALAILHGDVFIDGQRLVKPDDLAAALRRKVVTWDFRTDDGRPGPGSDWRRSVAHGDVTWIWDSLPLRPDGTSGAESSRHSDIRDGYLRAEGDLGRGAGAGVVLTLTRAPRGKTGVGVRWTLTTGADGTRLVEQRAEGTSDVLFEDGTTSRGSTTAELAYVDGAVHVRVGGTTWRGVRAAPDAPLGWEVGTLGREARLTTVSLDADIHYTHHGQHGVPAFGGKPGADVTTYQHRIPDGSFFALGDNSTDSNDSRFRDVGDVPYDAIVGPVIFRVWPLGRLGSVR